MSKPLWHTVKSARRVATAHQDASNQNCSHNANGMVSGILFTYDPIGTRVSASETIGGETLLKNYTANELNQYTTIANSAAVGLRGDATNSAVVTVNGESVQSDNIASDTVPWHFALKADNSSGSNFPFAEIMAVVNPSGTNTPDIVSTSSGHLYAPPQTETLTYDLDGNLLSDGRWHYTYNGENRLIKAEELLSPTNRQPYTVEYAYDHQGRMVWKQISTNAVVVSTRTLHWDYYNIIRETINHQQPTTNYYVWGLDLDGTMQGAGGIGGLLAASLDGSTVAYCHDANGNVSQLVIPDGELLAHYEYSPFGEAIVATGPLAKVNPFRFSTKHWDNLTGLGYWGDRWYGPGLGRWPSRDPINDVGFRKMLPDRLGIGPLDGVSDRLFDLHGEQANVLLSEILRKLPEPKRVYLDEEANLYDFISNDLVNSLDLLGLKLCVCCFKGSKGKLFIDASCKGVLSIWIIDEGSAPAAGGTSGSWINADGYVLGGTTYKIDGSTCVKMTCTASTLTVETCVNLIAGAIGKKPPYAVPSGTFDGPPKEPPTGSPPPVVK